MQPLSSLFTNGGANKNGSSANNDSSQSTANIKGRSGKSRNVSDQCYNQRD